MKPRKLVPGDVVQLGPDCANPAFAYCFMTITEAKAFGAQGYVQALGTRETRGGQAYYRAKWEEMEPLGAQAQWVAA